MAKEKLNIKNKKYVEQAYFSDGQSLFDLVADFKEATGAKVKVNKKTIIVDGVKFNYDEFYALAGFQLSK